MAIFMHRGAPVPHGAFLTFYRRGRETRYGILDGTYRCTRLHERFAIRMFDGLHSESELQVMGCPIANFIYDFCCTDSATIV